MKRLACAALATLLAACSSSNGAGGGSGTNADAGPDATVTTGSNDAGTTVGAEDATAATDDGGAGIDAGCGAFANDPNFTCTSDGNARAKCVGGSLDEQACADGCLRLDAGEDSICMGDASDWSCTGSYGTAPVDDGNYYMSEFGCYADDAGVHTDPDDNCIPSCLAQAQAAGLCDAGGPACEEALGWFTADGARFGCLQRLRVTNPANGKSLIAIALDYGPGCTGENNVSHAVLDSSGPVNDYLFGSGQGASQKSLVHVVEVDDGTPLGPVP